MMATLVFLLVRTQFSSSTPTILHYHFKPEYMVNPYPTKITPHQLHCMGSGCEKNRVGWLLTIHIICINSMAFQFVTFLFFLQCILFTHYTLYVELSFLPPQEPAHSSPSPPHQWAPTHVLEVTLPTPVSLAQVLQV